MNRLLYVALSIRRFPPADEEPDPTVPVGTIGFLPVFETLAELRAAHPDVPWEYLRTDEYDEPTRTFGPALYREPR